MKKSLFLFLLINIVNYAQVTLTTSSLPIFVINTNGQEIKDEPKITATLGIIYNGVGKTNSITDPFNHYNGKIGIEIRGHSSQSFPKKQYGVELRDDAGNDLDSPLLGLPTESDWVLNASYIDKSLLRNVIAYKLGNDLGRYSSRTRFCEVIINNQYQGVYILQEKVKRDKNRVNIKKLEAADISGDNLTGGYIIKIDRIDPGDKYFISDYPAVFPKTPSQSAPVNYIHVYPNADDILPVQQNYIRNYVYNFETSLSKSTYNDPFDGYYDYIDVDAWIDYYLVSEFTKATDAYRLSTYLYKDRDSQNGKLVLGPLWDYDLSFGLADYGDGWKYDGWVAQVDPWEGGVSPAFWIKKIFNDPVFFNKLAKRWHTIKQSVFDPSKLVQFMDTTSLSIVDGRIRNFNKWPELFDANVYIWPNKNRFTNYNDELLYLKSWIIQRYNWIDKTLPSNYSDVVWKQPGKRWLIYQTGQQLKLPLSLFYDTATNVTSMQFVSKDVSATFGIIGDSLVITSSRLGELVFKGIVKKNTTVVSISPEYRINLATGIEDESVIPTKYNLMQNYPNPFNPETTISYQIPKESKVVLKVFDIIGNEIETLVNETKQPGNYKAVFKIDNEKFSSGIYFYQLKAGEYIQTKKMMLVK